MKMRRSLVETAFMLELEHSLPTPKKSFDAIVEHVDFEPYNQVYSRCSWSKRFVVGLTTGLAGAALTLTVIAVTYAAFILPRSHSGAVASTTATGETATAITATEVSSYPGSSDSSSSK